ncbi:MAG: aminopeptidase P family protein, partial [Vicinamibacterales bacterium]
MFDPAIYRERRNRLKRDVGSGLILLLGNDEVGMNYAANTYHFRQDSTFLYFFAVDLPGLAALIDVDQNTETLFGDDLTVADIVWTGPQPTIADQARPAAIGGTAPMADLEKRVAEAVAQGRRVHFLKPYRAEHTLKITRLLGLKPTMVASYRSEPLHKAVVAQRNVKSAAEVEEIEQAIGVSRQMYLAAMAAARPGKHEYDVVAEIIRVAKANGCDLSFPIICSVHGETLHNHHHANLMQKGDVMVLDSGVETPNRYASDITRTIPVGGTFTSQQRQIYEMVLRAQLAAIKAIKPGVPYKDVHLLAARSFATDLKAAGLMKGDVGEAVVAGAHALFFPHGLGHMIGLDVHDLENIGEQYVGYEPGVERSEQFGLGYLRLARKLKPGFVLTVEPGLYFIPQLIDQWKAEKHNEAFINYAEVDKYRDMRGYRIEDDVLVTESG